MEYVGDLQGTGAGLSQPVLSERARGRARFFVEPRIVGDAFLYCITCEGTHLHSQG